MLLLLASATSHGAAKLSTEEYVTHGKVLLRIRHFKEIQPTFRDDEKARSLYHTTTIIE